MTERRSKYNAKPVEADGYHFDSTAEYNRYCELKLLESNGDIKDLLIHQRFCIAPAEKVNGKLFRAIWYEADFSYTETANWNFVVEDVKGAETAVFKLKWGLVNRMHPQIDWRIVK